MTRRGVLANLLVLPMAVVMLPNKWFEPNPNHVPQQVDNLRPIVFGNYPVHGLENYDRYSGEWYELPTINFKED